MADALSDAKKKRLAALEKRQQGGQQPNPEARAQRTGARVQGRTQSPQRASPGPLRQLQPFQQQPSQRSASPLRPLANQKAATEAEAPVEPIYRELDAALLDGLDLSHLGFVVDEKPEESPMASVQGLLRALLESNAKVADVGTTLEGRLQDKALLLENPPGAGAAAERARRRQQRALGKRSPRHLSQAQHRRLGTWTIPPTLQKYSLYAGLHELWKGYIAKLTTDCSEAILQARLLSADLHGSVMAVVRCKDPVMVGREGIVVRETRQTFHFITKMDALKVVLKKGTVFALDVNHLRITLYGDSLGVRFPLPAGQAKKTTKSTLEL